MTDETSSHSWLRFSSPWYASAPHRPPPPGITLYAPQFPTGNSGFARHDRQHPGARGRRIEAKVNFNKEGQAEIEVDYKDMKPAVLLFGGDITAYVVWAVSSKDGCAVNLGELATRDAKGSIALSNRAEELCHSHHRRAVLSRSKTVRDGDVFQRETHQQKDSIRRLFPVPPRAGGDHRTRSTASSTLPGTVMSRSN